MATASFDGEIIIWNLVSGHAAQRINGQIDKIYDMTDNECIMGNSVNGPFILHLVSYKKFLIAAHANGKILFYNLLGAKVFNIEYCMIDTVFPRLL